MIKIIKTLSNHYVLVDEPKFEFLAQWNWSIGSNGYPKRQCRINGKNKTFYMHREIIKTLFDVDHIDGDKTDCRAINLRECDPCQNLQNRSKQKNNTSGFKGVHLLKRTGRFQSQIRANHTRWHLGYFSTAKEAALAYDEAAKKYHGEFARLNFPESST